MSNGHSRNWLPQVISAPRDLEARTELLRGACHGGAALAGSMLALAHAMAQAKEVEGVKRVVDKLTIGPKK